MAASPTGIYPIQDGVVALTDCLLKFDQCAVILTGSKSYESSGSLTPSFGYSMTAKGKKITHDIFRQFIAFDVRNYSGSITDPKLKVYSTNKNTGNKYRAVLSTAFGGNGSKPIEVEDFGTIDRSKSYTGTETAWVTSSFNYIPLNNLVTSSISESSYLTLALIDGDFDYPLGTPSVPGDYFKSIYQSGSLYPPELLFTHSFGWTGGDIMGI